MVHTHRAERFTVALAEHGEGPVWLAESGQLACVDMLAGDILTMMTRASSLSAVTSARWPRPFDLGWEAGS